MMPGSYVRSVMLAGVLVLGACGTGNRNVAGGADASADGASVSATKDAGTDGTAPAQTFDAQVPPSEGGSTVDSGGGTKDAGSGKDSSTAGPYEGVACGASVCTGGKVCCQKPSMQCVDDAACGDEGIKFVCDGPEDCDDGYDCCGYGGTSCTLKDKDNILCKGGDNYLCHADSECGLGRECCPAQGAPFKVCRYDCNSG